MAPSLPHYPGYMTRATLEKDPHQVAAALGLTARAAYAAGVAGARCDEATRTWLVKQSRRTDWG